MTAAIDPFHAITVSALAHRLKEGGRDVIHMEFGQPSTGAPSKAIAKAHEILDVEAMGYWESPDLRARIARLYYGAEDSKGGAVEFRGEKAGIIHAGIGKASFTEAALVENARALVDALVKAKPTGAKGTYVRRVSMSSTMGPGVKVDTASAINVPA